MKAMTQKC